MAKYVTIVVENGKKVRREIDTTAVMSTETISVAVSDYLVAHPPASYTHPSTHPANMIVQDATHRFHTDMKAAEWDGKSDPSHDHNGAYSLLNHSHTGVYATSGHTHAWSPLYARVTGSDATTMGQSLTDITGLSLSLEANSVYEIYACLIVGVSAVTTGQQFGVNLSSTSGATISAGAFGTLAAATAQGKRISAFNTATAAFNTASGGTGIIIISGVVTTGGVAPTLTVRHLKVTSGTSTVYIGSFVSAVKIQ